MEQILTLAKLVLQVQELNKRTDDDESAEVRSRHMDEMFAIDDLCSKTGVPFDESMSPVPKDTWTGVAEEFITRVTERFFAQPNGQDLLDNRTTKGLPIVNAVAQEMNQEYHPYSVLRARRQFLYPN